VVLLIAAALEDLHALVGHDQLLFFGQHIRQHL
jgi:hypothetical protein